jgi:membrane protease YdiL (CAAX protease family)
LKKYGTAVALIFSSIAFGLMHLNVYLGDDWNPVNAYWHCLSAAGFGFLAAAVMLAMKSILPAIIMHALFDWPVVFSPPSKDESSDYVPHFDPLWQTIKDSFAEIMIDVSIGLVLLLIARGIRFKRIPRLVMRGLLKFRLVEES